MALHDPNPLPNCVGYIHTKMSPLEVARNASEDARGICLREYGSAPDINIYGDPDFTFPYVLILNHGHHSLYKKSLTFTVHLFTVLYISLVLPKALLISAF